MMNRTRYQSDIEIPKLGKIIDVEIHARHVTLFGVKTGNAHAIGFQEIDVEIRGEDEETGEGKILQSKAIETVAEAVYRVFGATLTEIT